MIKTKHRYKGWNDIKLPTKVKIKTHNGRTTTARSSMKKRKILTPLALALPGLLATCAYGGYSNSSDPNSGGPTWSSAVDAATGYTYADYSGNSATYVYRWIQGYDIICGCCSTLTKDTWQNTTAVTASWTWNSTEYSSGHCNVSDSAYDDFPRYGNGADSQVWATGATMCQ
jgi:hypothetical protein